LVVALTAQWLPIHSFGVAVGTPNQPPNWSGEFLGTDGAGRSMLSGIVYGARVSGAIAVIATAVSAVVGGVLGLLSAYFESIMRTLGEVIANTLLAVPGLLLAIFIVLVFGSSVAVITLACSLIFVAPFLRLTRSNAASELTREYIVAARGLGASPWRIMFRELLPNVWPSLISFAALVMPAVIILEGSLSFLGYGVQSPTPSWGDMIAAGSQELATSLWPALIPCVFLVITVFCLITIGDHLRIRLAPRGAPE
jgi:peptide/nickel transport system permease protein